MTSLAATHHSQNARLASFSQCRWKGPHIVRVPPLTFGMAEASGGKPKDPGKEPESPKAPEPPTHSGDMEKAPAGQFLDGKWYQKEDSGFQNPASSEGRDRGTSSAPGSGTPDHVVTGDEEVMDTTPAAESKDSEPPIVASEKKDSGDTVVASSSREERW